MFANSVQMMQVRKKKTKDQTMSQKVVLVFRLLSRFKLISKLYINQECWPMVDSDLDAHHLRTQGKILNNKTDNLKVEVLRLQSMVLRKRKDKNLQRS